MFKYFISLFLLIVMVLTPVKISRGITIQVIEAGEKIKKRLEETEVRVTFYNPDDPLQTDDSPGICAWLHKFELGDKIIAVSRDLEDLGLTDGKEVFIEGIGTYIVRDRMHERWKKSIDIAISDPKLSFSQRKKKAYKLGSLRTKIQWKKENG